LDKKINQRRKIVSKISGSYDEKISKSTYTKKDLGISGLVIVENEGRDGYDPFAIHKAIDKLPRNPGGIIFLQEGEYNIISKIVMQHPYLTLEGCYSASWLKTTANIPLIEIKRPTGNVNLGSHVKNLAIKGPGRANTSAHGILIDNAWGVDLENVIIGSCRHGIHIINGGLRRAENIFIDVIGEWGLGNCFRGINCEVTAGNGLLSFLKNIEIGRCESHAVYIRKVDSIWGVNWRVMESGGSGLKIDESVCGSNMVNIQLDCMHQNGLELNSCIDFTFNGVMVSAAPAASAGYPEFGIPAGAGLRALLINNSKRIEINNGNIWWGAAANEVAKIMGGSWQVTLTGLYFLSEGSHGVVIDSSSQTTIAECTVDAPANLAKTGVKYQGTAPTSHEGGTKLIGSTIHAFATKHDLSIDLYHQIFACPPLPTIFKKTVYFEDVDAIGACFKNNAKLRWKQADGVERNVLCMGPENFCVLEMYGGFIYDPKNYVDATLSGTPKIVEIKIGGVSYFFKVYPTKG